MLLKKNFKFSKKSIIIGLSIIFIVLYILYVVIYNNKTNDKKLIEGNNGNPPSYLLGGLESSKSGKTTTKSEKQVNDINS
tara:strand:- start:2721 stop:2960 length:240 start_codon:yes stop_codon:yes gene_type:complete